MPQIARHVLVSGRVQGVAFRYTTAEAAETRGARGWVRNLTDGRVEAWVEGGAREVEGLLAWLRDGPGHARVDRLEVREEDPLGLEGFEIRPTVH